MSSCVDLKPPVFWRCSTMRAASFSPTPGSVDSSDAVAVLRLTLPVGAALWTRDARVAFADEAGFAVWAAKLVVETRAASARARPPARIRFIFFMTALLYWFEFPKRAGRTAVALHLDRRPERRGRSSMASRTAILCRAVTSLSSGGSPGLSHSRPPPVRRPRRPLRQGPCLRPCHTWRSLMRAHFETTRGEKATPGPRPWRQANLSREQRERLRPRAINGIGGDASS